MNSNYHVLTEYIDFDRSFDEPDVIPTSGETCKFCYKDGLQWRKTKGKWRLFENSTLHECKPYRKEIKRPITEALSRSKLKMVWDI